jgi:RNA polymerase sigma-70 factor (ECF subfamily)
MKRINLRDYYPHYPPGEFVCVPDGIYLLLREFELAEAAYLRRIYRHKAYYSLDLGDGIETEALFPPPMPGEVLEQKERRHAIYKTILDLPEKQARRIYAHFFLGISKTEIAQAEGVSGRTVRQSIDRALISLHFSRPSKDCEGVPAVCVGLGTALRRYKQSYDAEPPAA